jgi:non-heme chloroperoxidase
MHRHNLLVALGAIPVTITAALGGMIVFGVDAPPPPLASVYDAVRAMPRDGLPPIGHYRARDGAELAYRSYAGSPNQVLVLIHGSTGNSGNMHLLAKALTATGATIYTLDMRGHGQSGRRGDIDYRGQLDDDLADFVAAVTPPRPGRRMTLIGFSAGGGFALRFAGSSNGELFDNYVLLAPYLGPWAPTNQAGNGGWATPYLPRAYALAVLDALGIHWFEGLPIVAYARRPNPNEPAPTYSYRLSRNFGADLDFRGDFRRTRRPISVIVGGADDQMIANRYALAIAPVRSDVPVEVVPGVGHVGIIMAPAALEAIRATVARGQ